MGLTKHEQIMEKLGEIKGTQIGMLNQLKTLNARTTKSEDKIVTLQRNQDKLTVKLGIFGASVVIISGLFAFLKDRIL